ncbi:MAG: hypothetical protein WC307_01675 [Candidatus Nanoarchaeia archaeon]
MNGITQFNDLMRNLEREEFQRETLKEWYRQRNKTVFQAITKPINNRNN